MPTTEPIGPLSPLASPAPVRSAANPNSPADGTNDNPQPSRGFLESLRKAQRGGTDDGRPAAQSDAVDRAALQDDPTVPDARAAVGESDPAPPVPDAPAVENAALEAQAAILACANEALGIPTETPATPEVPVAPAPAIVPVTATSSAPAATLPDVTDTLSLPIPAETVAPPARPAPTMPAALQDWLSVKPTPGPKPAAAAPVADGPVEESPATDPSSADTSTTMPPGLQIALSAVMAAQAAAQPVLSAKIVAAAPGVPGQTGNPAALPEVSAAAASVPPVAAVPVNVAGTNELAEPPPELPTVPAPTVPLAVPTPVVEASRTVAIKTSAPTAEDETSAVPVDQDASGTSAVPSPAVTVTVPIPVVAATAVVQQTAAKPDGPRIAALPAAGPIAPPVTAPPPTTTAESSASSAVMSADAPATSEAATGLTTTATVQTAPATVDDWQPAATETTRPPTAAVNDVAPEPAAEQVAPREPAGLPSADRTDLGPLVADRTGPIGAAAPSAPVTQVAPHDPQVFVDRVSQLVLHAHDSGQQLSLQITPPDLGTVRIEVHSHGGVLTARLEADSTAARQLLTEHLPQLREALQQQGATVERIDVYQSDRSGPGEGMTDSNWQSSQQEGRQDAVPLLYDEEEAAAVEPAEARGSLALGELNIRI